MSIFGFKIGTENKTPEQRTFNLLKIKIDNIIIHLTSLKNKLEDSTKLKHFSEFNEDLTKFFENLDTFHRIFNSRGLISGINSIQEFKKKNSLEKIKLNAHSSEKSINTLIKEFEEFKTKVQQAE